MGDGLGEAGAWKRAPGRLVHTYWHVKYGDMWVELDEKTLEFVGHSKAPPRYPLSLLEPESTFPGMEVHWSEDLGAPGGARYVLRWESLAPHRDRPRSGDLPPPSRLRVIAMAGAPVDTAT